MAEIWTELSPRHRLSLALEPGFGGQRPAYAAGRQLAKALAPFLGRAGVAEVVTGLRTAYAARPWSTGVTACVLGEKQAAAGPQCSIRLRDGLLLVLTLSERPDDEEIGPETLAVRQRLIGLLIGALVGDGFIRGFEETAAHLVEGDHEAEALEAFVW